MKKEKIKVEVGQMVNVDIRAPYKGKFPIGMYNGTIFCRLYIPKSVGRIEIDSTCLCQVTEVTEKTLMVTIKEVIKSPAANRYELEQKLKSVEVEDQSKSKKKKNLAMGEALVKATHKPSKN